MSATKTKSADASGNYAQIFRASALLGGSQAMVYTTLIARAKIAAHLLGPAGVGTLGIFQSILTFVTTLAGLGISTSGVRQISMARDEVEKASLPEIAGIIRRISYLSAIGGLLIFVLFGGRLIDYLFKGSGSWLEMIFLGTASFFASLASARVAVVQGCRRTGDLARCQTVTALVASTSSVLLFLLLGREGIAPALAANAVISFGVSSYYLRRLKLPKQAISWRQTCDGGKAMFGMGIAFMWNGVVSSAVAMASRAVIVKDLGLAQNGIFQSTWTLSGMFATFLLSAMGSDFYPRLSAASDDRERMNELVNQQTEIGIILALPALLLTLALAPGILVVFYSREFLSGSHLLPWLVLGVFLQVVSWPLGFIQMAKGQSRRYIISQTLFNVSHLSLVVLLMKHQGLIGVGVALPVVYSAYTVCMLVYCRWDNGFIWSRAVVGLLLLSALAIVISLSVAMLGSGLPALLGRVGVGVFTGFLSLRALCRRLPESHRIRRFLVRCRLA